MSLLLKQLGCSHVFPHIVQNVRLFSLYCRAYSSDLMTELTRRNAIRVCSGSALALIAGGGVLTYSSESAVAATGLTANDVSVSSADGSLTTLTITPDITVSWDGQETEVAEIQATWYVKTSSTSETTVGSTPYSITVSSPGTNGSVDHTFPEISLLSNNGGALSGSNFDATTDGGSTTTTVTLSMDVTLKDSGSNTITSQTDVLGPQNYDITVNNTESSVNPSISSSGTANTNGS
ncbi:hypothetical protein SAMN05216564_11813 [Halopenitus persicus]|uniref:Uncharacterized protein n=1 Tax=Halopenitus persicus TaxID=1048396 RepID=A0A1H3P242_9EURY|nr:hypothetical protein SAMN05216564_11813 [Halopenitus persicus]